jgi:integrase/recombinase XerC
MDAKQALAAITSPEGSLQNEVFDVWELAAVEWLSNHKRPNTRAAYRRVWSAFLDYMLTLTGDAHPANVQMMHILAYREAMRERGYSDSSINQALAALASFYSYAQSKGLTQLNPAQGVKRFNVTKYGKATWLDYEEGVDKRLLESIERKNEQGKRDYALILLFLTTALRVSEAANLRIGNIQRQGKIWRVQFVGKGNKDRNLKLPPIVVTALQDYFQARQVGLGDQRKAVFTAWDMDLVKERKQRPIAAKIAVGDEPLSARRIQQIIKERCDALLGAGHQIHPHSLRHTALGKALAHGATMQDLQQLAGHSDVATALIYAQSVTGNAAKMTAMLGQLYEED